MTTKPQADQANETPRTSTQQQSGCCGGPAPQESSACCDKDHRSKATGGTGCGCKTASTPVTSCC
jgi:hypothetical protein